MPKISVLADKDIYGLESIYHPDLEIKLFNGKRELPILNTEEALLIRTVTPINESTFMDLKQLKYVGTATAGFDHIDLAFLKEQNIHFASSIGCNALAVAEYIASTLILWSEESSNPLQNTSIAIVGCGYVGSEVAKLSKILGLEVIEYDPPKEKREPNFISANIDEVLDADILTFHCDLNPSSKQLFNENLFGESSYKLMINAARGDILDEEFTIKMLKKGQIEYGVIDCWPNEPYINLELLDLCFIGTPHIAGYSKQGKQNATLIQLNELIQFFDLSKLDIYFENHYLKFEQLEEDLTDILSQIHPIKKYHNILSEVSSKQNINDHFQDIRSNTPLRNEFRYIELENKILEKFPILKKLGIHA